MKRVKQAMYNEQQSIIKNKEGRQLQRFYVCMLHTAASVAVPKLDCISRQSYVVKDMVC
jgi:hypothetical protein